MISRMKMSRNTSRRFGVLIWLTKKCYLRSHSSARQSSSGEKIREKVSKLLYTTETNTNLEISPKRSQAGQGQHIFEEAQGDRIEMAKNVREEVRRL